jgi:hypothetical protein
MSKSHWSVIMRLSNILEAFVDRKLIVGTLNPPAAHDTSDDHRNPPPSVSDSPQNSTREDRTSDAYVQRIQNEHTQKMQSELERIQQAMADPRFSDISIVRAPYIVLKLIMKVHLRNNSIVTGHVYYDPDTSRAPYTVVKQYEGASQHRGREDQRYLWSVNQVIQFLLSN